MAAWQAHAAASNRAFEIVVELLVVYLLLEFGRIATGCDVATNARCVARYVEAGGDEPDVILSECGRLKQRCTHSLSKHVWSKTRAGNRTGEPAAPDFARINGRYGGVIALCGCLFESDSDSAVGHAAGDVAVPEDREIYCDLDTQRAQFFWLGIIIIFFNDWSMGTRRLRTFRPVGCVASVLYLIMLGLAFDPDADLFGTLRSCSNSVEYVLKADMLRQISFAAAMLLVPLTLVEVLHWWAAAAASEKAPRPPGKQGHASAGQLPVYNPHPCMTHPVLPFDAPCRCPLWPGRRKGSAALTGLPPLPAATTTAGATTRPSPHKKLKASPAVSRRGATVASAATPPWQVGAPLSREVRGPHRMASWHGRRTSRVVFLAEPPTTLTLTVPSKLGAPHESSPDRSLDPRATVEETTVVR